MSDLLNNAAGTGQQPVDGDPYKVAADYLDKIFHLIPEYGGFKLQDIIYSSDLINLQKLIADSVHDKMEYILKSEDCLETHSFYGNLTLQLNAHGRDVRSAGGLSAFKTQKQQAAIPNITNNIHQGDNYGNIVQSGHQSSLIDLELKNKSVADTTSIDTTHDITTLKKGTLKKIFSNPWIITVIGGLIIAFLAKLFGWV